MSNLVIVFEGMSLIVSDRTRSESFFVATDKVSSPHQHEHLVTIDDHTFSVSDALVWVEDRETRLEGRINRSNDLLIEMKTIKPGDPLAPPLTTPDPEANRAWLDRLAVWFRLPGGNLETAPTPGPGGSLSWTFPKHSGTPAQTRLLTQTAILRRPDVTGPVRLAVQAMATNVVEFHHVPQGPNGDYQIDITTAFTGAAGEMPTLGSAVQLLEMQLMYACLQSGSGPIPSVIWPLPQREGIPVLTSDPVTGICPVAFMDL